MQDTERELKAMLSQEQADKLLKSSAFTETRVQKNTYYDNPDQSLKQNGMALRIRTIESDQVSNQKHPVEAKYILTIKKPLDSITKYEYERPVHTNKLKDLNEEERSWVQDHLNADQTLDSLNPIASFTTTRHICQFPDAEYSVDHTVFDHHEDYEAEYEYRKQHDGIKAFNRILSAAGLQWTKNGPSKIARAFQS